MQDGGLIARGSGEIRGWIHGLPVTQRDSLRTEVNGAISTVANGQIIFEDPDASDIDRFSVKCDGFPRSGENQLQLFVGDRLVFNAKISYDRSGAPNCYFDIIKNSDIFRFDSDLLQRVPPKLPLSSAVGRDALRRELTTTKLIIVLFSNRSGSNLVTDVLEQYGLGSGATNEPFLANTILEVSSAHKFASLDHYLAETIGAWKKNDVCFLKMSWDALAWLGSEHMLSPFLRDNCIIWTRRRDRVAQAVSNLRALRTNTFFQRAAEKSDQAPVGFVTDHTVPNLVREIYNMSTMDMRLEYFITIYGLKPLELYFEDFTMDLPGAAAQIVDFVSSQLGLPNLKNKTTYKPSLSKQSTTDNDALREWFRNVMAEGLAAERQD